MTKTKYKFEFPMKASPKMLYSYISTASGLGDWFAEKVEATGNVYTFTWDGETSRAKLSHKREPHLVRFNWLDEPDKTYFEIEIVLDEITSDIELVVTDFSTAEEKDELYQLWDSQIHQLKMLIGS